MTKFAIGCLIQWYECNIIGEYVDSLREAINEYGGEVIVHFHITSNTDLEKPISDKIYKECLNKIETTLLGFKHTCTSNKLHTIADYRREFNDKFCETTDVLIWGESDAILPKQMFVILDNLHQQVKDQTPKYLGFFGGCKMWDDSWKDLEHPDFTDKPFIEGDTKNWWSLRYTMSKDEMNKINSKTEELDVRVLPQHKFNGCGLVISSEVVKAGANIPRGMFFVHEDTAFMNMTNKILGNIPQYVINNILLVHNRKHHSKRCGVKGEEGIDPTNTGLLREQHTWYQKAYDASTQNLNNLFNPNYKFKTWKDVL
tara:strand:+ start:960 stop:1901 length:942 start_codon:yes stop_codon:yes gene_type:complete